MTTISLRRWRRHTLMALAASLLSVLNSEAQCVDPGSSINFTNNGQNTTGYSTTFVLTDGEGTILEQVPNPFNAPSAEGNYRVYAVNYKTAEANPVLTPGTNISSIGGSCVAVSAAPLLFSVCICVAPNTALSFSGNGNNINLSYQTRYITTNSSGNIINTSASGSMNSPTGSGEFLVYQVNYRTGETDPLLANGTNITALGGSCVDLSRSFIRYKVCGMYDYSNLPAGWPLAYAGVSCMLDGNAPMNYDSNTNPFHSVFAGTQISLENSPAASGIDAGDDGLSIPNGVTAGAGPFNYQVTLNANRPNQQVYYRLWFDWNGDGNFANDDDFNGLPASYEGSAIINGPETIDIPVLPAAVISGNYKIRLVVSDAPIPDIYRIEGPTAILFIANGEVEDYRATLSALPLNLLSFELRKQGYRATTLEWKTTNEVNTKSFQVERSANGMADWKILSAIPAAGNSGAERVYTSVDQSAMEGNNFYRLKMLDIDGKFSYSPVRMISFSADAVVKLFPNPVQQTLQVSVPFSIDAQVLVVRDITSRELVRKKINGLNTLSIEMGGYKSGVYTLELVSDNKVLFREKIVKQ